MSTLSFNDDADSIIGTIQDSVKIEQINVEPGDYTTREVFRVPDASHAKGLAVASLSGLADYINGSIDGETRRNTFVLVQNAKTVYFTNDIASPEDRRFFPIAAEADTPQLIFDQYRPKEEVMIMLQSRFVENEERNTLLEQLGLLVADEEIQQEDDGVTQRITTQAGIRRSESKIINPVNLRPFRTFTEIDQPESPFIVRLAHTDKNGIQVALFEADGGQWRNVARQSIKAYLSDKLTDVNVIA